MIVESVVGDSTMSRKAVRMCRMANDQRRTLVGTVHTRAEDVSHTNPIVFNTSRLVCSNTTAWGYAKNERCLVDVQNVPRSSP
jgi:hypothetical protein